MPARARAAPPKQPASAATGPGGLPSYRSRRRLIVRHDPHHAPGVIMAGWAPTHGEPQGTSQILERIRGTRDEIADDAGPGCRDRGWAVSRMRLGRVTT